MFDSQWDGQESWKLLLEWWPNTNNHSHHLLTLSPDLLRLTVRHAELVRQPVWEAGWKLLLGPICTGGGWRLWWWATSPQLIITWLITLATSGWQPCACTYNQSKIKLLTELKTRWCIFCQLTRDSVICVPLVYLFVPLCTLRKMREEFWARGTMQRAGKSDEQRSELTLK